VCPSPVSPVQRGFFSNVHSSPTRPPLVLKVHKLEEICS
jgi:hypothetical protein